MSYCVAMSEESAGAGAETARGADPMELLVALERLVNGGFREQDGRTRCIFCGGEFPGVPQYREPFRHRDKCALAYAMTLLSAKAFLERRSRPRAG